MTRLSHLFLAILLALAVTFPAFADDQQKAQKEINKITAMATDGTGRRMVSMAMSDTFNVKRPDLVQERRDTQMNYGSLFAAHELINSGAKMSDIAAQLKAGKNILQIADERHANWKQLALDAKKLNGKVNDRIYQHFVHEDADTKRDQADNYDVMFDGVKADSDVSPKEVADAQDTYLLWKDRGLNAKGRDKHLETADERAAYIDHARSAGPQSQGSSGGAAPAAGGIK
jgi:hypothetical protein